MNFHTSDKYNREQIKIIFEDFVAKKAFRLISFFSRAIEIQENLDVSGYRCIVKCSSVARGSAGSSTYEQQPVEKKISHSPKGCASVCYKMAGEWVPVDGTSLAKKHEGFTFNPWCLWVSDISFLRNEDMEDTDERESDVFIR